MHLVSNKKNHAIYCSWQLGCQFFNSSRSYICLNGRKLRTYLLARVFQCFSINSHLSSILLRPLPIISIQNKLSCGRTLFSSKLNRRFLFIKWTWRVRHKPYQTVLTLDWKTERLTEWLNDWLKDWTLDWRTERLTEGLNDWLKDWTLDWRTERLTEGLNDWLNDWTIDWRTERLTEWLIDWLSMWLNAWLADCITTWLTGWLAE